MSRELLLLFPDFFSFMSDGKANPFELASRQRIFKKFFLYSGPYQGYERELLEVFGIGGKQNDVQSWIANILAARDLEGDDEEFILRADPVYLKADQNRVFLFDGQNLGIEKKEAEKILAELNSFYSDDSFYFSMGDKPWRWYLRRGQYVPPKGESPIALRGSPLEITMDERLNMGGLRTLLTEVQMILHSSKTNEIRNSRNDSPINSLWFWGGRRSQGKFFNEPPSFKLMTNCDLAINIASYIKLDNLSVLETAKSFNFGNVKNDTLIIIDPTEFDFQNELHETILEKFFNQINTGVLRRVRLITRLGHFRVTPLSKLRFWERSRSFRSVINNESKVGDLLF